MKKAYIETYGCQMNVADSALISNVLAEAGYERTDSVSEASLVLLNTCAIRERAEDRVVNRLESLARLKRLRPDLVLGVTGCVPKHLGEGLRARLPHVDLLVGPDSYRRLPELVEEAAQRPVVDLRLDVTEDYRGCDSVAVEGAHAFIPVMRGCDRFCAFCVVPLVRGREKSLPLDEVQRTMRNAVDRGASAVTLLGQTVNSYHHGEHGFSDLLEAASRVPGCLRVRFTSPYPADFTEDHFRIMAERETLMPSLHLPVQSGSNRILWEMKRGYTREDFLRLIDAVHRHLPEAGLSTDIIVGHPGETDEDFEETLSLLREVEFDSAFLFRYSERSGTWAARHLPDTVPLAVKAQRLDRVIALQEEISRRRFGGWVGRDVEVLVEGRSRRDPEHGVGKSADGKTVIFPFGPPPGSLTRVRIERATSHSLLAAGL